jgi:hypothetical protein
VTFVLETVATSSFDVNSSNRSTALYKLSGQPKRTRQVVVWSAIGIETRFDQRNKWDRTA